MSDADGTRRGAEDVVSAGAGAICRTALYMPASSARALAKGPTLVADAIIVDLEDAVAPAAKAEARDAAVRALRDQDYGSRIRALRVNGAATEWFADDVAALSDAAPEVVVLPKAESATAIRDLAETLAARAHTRDLRIWAMLETPLAVLRADAIAEVARDGVPLEALVVGSNDLASSGGLAVECARTHLHPWLMIVVAAAKAHGVRVLDGVFNDIADTAGFERECAEGVAMGMEGKTLIHPSQIDAANRLWSPDARAIEAAQAIVAAFDDDEAAGQGVIRVDGRMVERLHLEVARRTLALAARLDGQKIS